MITVVPPSASDNNNPPSGSVPVAPTPLEDATYEKSVNKGKPNGYAALDSGGKVPAAQLPSASVQGSPVSVSTWDSIQGKPGAFPPVPHAASHGVGGADPVIISKSQISDWPATFPPDASAIQTSIIGQPNGVASLGSDGKVPSAQLPAIGSGSGDMLRSTYDTNADGVVDHAALADVAASVSYNNVTNAPGLATTSAQGFCPPFDGTSIVLSGGKLTATGGGGGGSGDMLKSTYDANNDGIVDHAALADAAPYSGLTGKPTLGTSSALDAPASGDASSGQVVKGSDSRLTNSRTATSHASTHGSAGSDPVTLATSQITGLGSSATLNVAASGNAASGEVVKGNDTRLTDARTPTAHTHPLSQVTDAGTSASHDVAATGNASSTQVVLGNDSRLSDSRTPVTHASSHASGGSDPVSILKAQVSDLGTIGTAAALNIASSGNASTSQVVKGDDTRLSDSRTPTSHASSHRSGGSDALKIDELAAGTDVTTLNASTTVHGLLPKLSGTGTQYLNGTGGWSTPAGTGGAGDMSSADYAAGTGASNTNTVDHALYANAAPYSGITGTPTLGTSAAKDIPASGNASSTQVVYGNDTRLSDARTPVAHEASHVTGGSDVIPAPTTSASGLVPILPATGASAKFLNGAAAFAQVAYADVTGTPTLGTSASHDVAASGNASSAQVVLGNDSRLSDTRTPAAHASTHASGGSDPVTIANTQVTGLGTSSTHDVASSGNASSAQVVLGNDGRLSDARTPTAHASSHLNGGSDAIANATATVGGLVPAPPNDANKVYLGNSTWGFLGQQTETNGTFTVPAAGSTVAVTIVSASWPVVGQTVLITDGTRVLFGEITVVTSATSITVKNQGYNGNSTSGTMATASIVKLMAPGFATATQAGFVPTPPNDATKFMSGASTFVAVPYSSLSGTPSSFTPSAHASTHGNGGSDQITIVKAQVSDFPTLGTAAAKDIPASGNASSTQVVYGSDTRLTDARTPSAHESTHITGGSDVIPAPTTSASGLVPILPATGAASKFLNGSAAFAQVDYSNLTGTPTLGTAAAKDIPASGNASSTQVVYGSDTRLTDARTPSAHAASHASAGSDPVTLANTQVTGLGTSSTLNVPASGNAASGEVVKGNDTRLTDSRTPAAHASTHLSGGSDPISAATATASGLVPTPPNNTNKWYRGDSSWTFDAQATETNGTFTVPAAGSTVAVTIVSASWPVVGQTVLITDGTRIGFFEITVVTSATSITAANRGFLGNSTSGTMATGSTVRLVSPGIATATQPGYVPTPPNDATKVLTGAMTYAAVAYANVTGTPTLGTSAAKDIPSSGNASSTQVVYGTDTRLSDSRTPTAHASSHQSGGSDAIALDTLGATTDITTLNATTAAHGLLPKLGGGTTNFFRADGSYAAVAYSGLSGTPSTFSPSAHASTHQSGGSDSIALDALASTTDVTTLNATTSAHGLLPKLGGGTTNFFRADGAYAALPANSTSVAGTVAASPNDTNKVYLGDSTWGFLGQQTETNGTFTVPAAGSTVAVTIVSAAWPVVGQTVWISDGTRVGFFEITVVTSATSVTVKNQGYLGNSTSGTMATGSIVKLVGPNVATSTKPGFVPTPPNDATKFLDGTAAFSTVNYNNLSNLPTLGTSAAKDIPASGNASSTQVVYGSDTRLSDSRTPTAHATSHKSGGSDSIKLDEFAATTDVTTLNASTTAHGLLPKLAGGTTTFFRADGSYAAVAYSSLSGTPSTFSPSAHASSHQSGGGDSIALDTLAATTDITTSNASTSAHGLLPKLSGTATQYLDGSGAWSIPAGGGGGVNYLTTTNASFTCPAAGATVSVTFVSTATFRVGMGLWIDTVGLFYVSSITSGTVAVVFNVGQTGNATSGTITSGQEVWASGVSQPATATLPGYVPTPPNSTTQFLRGDATFAAIPASTATVSGLVPTPPNVASQFLSGLSTWVVPVMKPFKVWTAGIEGYPPSTLYGTFGVRNNRPYLAFNDSATWTAYFMTVVPTGASLGSGLIVRLKWMAATATTGNAVLGVAIERMTTDQDADSFDTQVTATTATSGTSGIAVETAITITTIDGVTALDGMIIQVQRLGANGSDTVTGDIQIETVSVETVN
jgi:hypothetical protein